jgi:hypothetical protein
MYCSSLDLDVTNKPNSINVYDRDVQNVQTRGIQKYMLMF